MATERHRLRSQQRNRTTITLTMRTNMGKTKDFGVFLRTPYNYDTDEASEASGLKCLDESKTKQSFQEEADINTIVRRFGLTGQLPSGIQAPTYGDFTEVTDFHTAMNAIAKPERRSTPRQQQSGQGSTITLPSLWISAATKPIWQKWRKWD